MTSDNDLDEIRRRLAQFDRPVERDHHVDCIILAIGIILLACWLSPDLWLFALPGVVFTVFAAIRLVA